MKLSFLVVFIFSILVLSAFFLPQKIFAVRSMTISSSTSVINGYDQMTVNVASMSGFTTGETIYIKGAFYKDGTTNYFGFTQNGSNWIKNGDATANQRQIQIGNWDGNIILQSDFSDSGYANYGEGDYKLKIGFYYLTSGGNLSSVNWSTNSLDVAINAPDPTVTPTLQPTNTPVPTATLTTKPSSTPTQKPTNSPTPLYTIAVATISGESSGSGVLGVATAAAPTLIKGIEDTKKNVLNLPALLEIIGGIFVLSSCGILFYYQKKGAKRATPDE